MKKMLHSLQTKLTVSFIILILAVCLPALFYTLQETKKAIKEIVRTELVAVSSVVASQLNGKDADIMESLKPQEEGTQNFIYLRDKLNSLRNSHQDLKYIYTMREMDDKAYFLVDADYGNKEDPGAKIGEEYKDATETLFQGFEKSIAEEDFYTDKWGTLLSGYSPIKNSQGDIIGLIGVDISSNLVLRKQQFLTNTIYGIICFGVFVAGLLIFIFSKTVIKDINNLNSTAQKISEGDMNVELNITRKDEIGELAESFSRMVASLKIMMMKDNQ